MHLLINNSEFYVYTIFKVDGDAILILSYFKKLVGSSCNKILKDSALEDISFYNLLVVSSLMTRW